MDLQNPLVSIVVVTYNSSEYILETLESAYNQTYHNVELIITDDCSADKTVEICVDWIDKHKERFIRTKIITSGVNTGIAGNCNRGINAAGGEWVKPIAGDDTMDSNCLSYFLKYVDDSIHSINIIHSNVNVYRKKIQKESFYKKQDKSADIFNHIAISAKQQYQLLLRKNWIAGPSIFFRKSFFAELKGYDETLIYEDMPFFLKATKMGYKIHFLNCSVVNYRIHNLSFYNKSADRLLFNDFFIKERLIYNKYRRIDLLLWERIVENFEFYRKLVFLKSNLNKNNVFNSVLNKPFSIINKVFERVRTNCIEKEIMKEINTNAI